MMTPPFGYYTQKTLDGIRDNVAPHILAALGLDDLTKISSSYHEDVVFQDMSFMFEGERVQGSIAINMQSSGVFGVTLDPLGRKLGWAHNLSGADLEDLIIELADI